MNLQYEELLDKPFIWGAQDCLTLFRKFYKTNFGIEITNYARPHDWSSDNLDLMRLCYEREGFDMITDWKAKDLRPGDVLCISIGEQNPNHFAIYLGENEILHHVYGRRSKKEPLHGFWRNHTGFLLRHPDVPDLRPVYPDVDIASILRARNAPPTG